jgi:hypothetical protein
MHTQKRTHIHNDQANKLGRTDEIAFVWPVDACVDSEECVAGKADAVEHEKVIARAWRQPHNRLELERLGNHEQQKRKPADQRGTALSKHKQATQHTPIYK